MRQAKHKSYRKLLRELREIVPTVAPVITKRRPLKDCLGYTTARWNDAGDHLLRFNIVIDSRLSWDATWQVLIHEWAHALAWREGHETITDHGPEWALAYAQIYGDVIAI